MSEASTIRLAIVGDLEINRDDPTGFFDKARDVLDAADIRFGGLEAPLSERGEAVDGKIVMRHPPRMVAAYVAGGFEVVAFASNHCLDYGLEPFVDTLDLLDQNGIAYVGAGRDIAEARRPAILERRGTRVAFLSYLQFLPLGWGAHPTKPGVAPIREDALYGPPYVNEEDLEAMAEDVAAARRQADVVVSSYHWGLSQSRTLTLSQIAVAHAAIDAGADLVIGRHPHILQGIEVYQGKAIFYSLGNFALDHDHPMFLPTVKESIVVDCLIEDGRIRRLSFRPAHLGEDGRPEILTGDDGRARKVISDLVALSAKRHTMLSPAGNEVMIDLGARDAGQADARTAAQGRSST